MARNLQTWMPVGGKDLCRQYDLGFGFWDFLLMVNNSCGKGSIDLDARQYDLGFGIFC